MECFVDQGDRAVGIVTITKEKLGSWLDGIPGHQARWVEGHGLPEGDASHLIIPGDDGTPARVLVITDGRGDLFALGDLPRSLPRSMTCRLEESVSGERAAAMALGWALGSYGFDRYRPGNSRMARLVFPSNADRQQVKAVAEAMSMGRDLINTPAEDLGPAELAGCVADLAERHRAGFSVIVGDDLVALNYPSVHAVGRASTRAPQLIDLSWGDPDAWKVTLVGKGVCFDSGGLDIKPSSGMKLMKKDMGGAASAIALASMIMDLELPVRLRLLVPAVDNAIAGNAYRPLDVFRTRKGVSIEIGNTDAEGRVILCDALAEASAAHPDLLIDFATLTGAARVALGTELPALFCNDDGLAAEIAEHCRRVEDPVWRLPLWPGYRSLLSSDMADLSTTGSSPFGGAITAALFLERFVDDNVPWVHIDLMGWNQRGRPGRPKGGEVMAARGLLAMIRNRVNGF